MANTIDHFEVNNWGELKIRVGNIGRQTEHTFYSVPKSIILKFLSAKKMPEFHEVEKWIKDAKEKRERADGEVSGMSCDWWSVDD